MAVDAETHVVIDDALGDRLVRQIAVARRAVDVGADMRGVLELDVRFVRKSVHALPWNLDPFSA